MRMRVRRGERMKDSMALLELSPELAAAVVEVLVLAWRRAERSEEAVVRAECELVRETVRLRAAEEVGAAATVPVACAGSS